jgi:hypothetical protein
MDIVFDQTFRVKVLLSLSLSLSLCQGADMPYRHSFAQVIYVMEDIDAASQIVLSREHKKPESEVVDEPFLGPLLEDGTGGGDDAALLLTMLTSLADTPGVGVATGTGTDSLEGFGMDSGGWLTVGGGDKVFDHCLLFPSFTSPSLPPPPLLLPSSPSQRTSRNRQPMTSWIWLGF